MSWADHTHRRQPEHRRAAADRDAGDVPVARPPERVKEVHIDGLVILKIIKHCRDCFPENVAGSLLGYEKDDGQGSLTGVLEVTHCFPAPPPDDDLDDTSFDGRYEVRMVKALKEVGVDQSSIGWYSSFYLSSFYTADTVAHQARYQSTVPSAVLIVYDSVRTAQGHLALRALRLTDAAMAAYKAAYGDVMRSARGGGFDSDRLDKAIIAHEAFAALTPSQLFEDVPIRIHNPHIVNALLVDLVDTAGMTASTAGVGGGSGSGGGAAVAGTIGGAAVAGAASSAAAAAATAGAAVVGGSSSSSSSAPSSFSSSASSSAVPLAEDSDFARLDLSTVSYLEKHLEMLNDFMGDMAKVQDSQAYMQRKVLRMQREREEWIARRRRENEERAAAGMAPLPEEDLSLPFFQPLRDKGSGAKDPLEAHLMSAQINTYCNNISRFAHQNFGKLFLTQSMAKGASGGGGGGGGAAAAE